MKYPNALLDQLCKVRINGEALQMLNLIIRKTLNNEQKKNSITNLKNFDGDSIENKPLLMITHCFNAFLAFFATLCADKPLYLGFFSLIRFFRK